jgi:hypothetical protein
MSFRFGIAASIGVLTAHLVWAAEPYDTFAKFNRFHIEIVSMSQQKIKGEKAGGPGGHIAMYIEGLCIDYTTGKTGRHSVLKPCSEVDNPTGFEHTGVTVSVDADLTNSNFFVTPGRMLGMSGLTDNPGKITKASRDAVIREALKWRVMDDIQVKPDVIDRNLSPAEYRWKLAENAVGTDYAFQFGRDALVTLIPIQESMLPKLAKFFMDRNRPYVTNAKPYVWNPIFDNCAMLVSGALEAVGFRAEIPANLTWYKQLFNVALPRNGYSTVQVIGHYGGRNAIEQILQPVHSGIEFENIHSNPIWWNALQEHGTIPIGLGVISYEMKMFQDNELYGTDVIVKRIPHKIIGANTMSDEVLDQPEFTNLRENATYWRWMMEKALIESQSQRVTSDRVIYQKWLVNQIELAKAVQLKLDPCGTNYSKQ